MTNALASFSARRSLSRVASRFASLSAWLVAASLAGCAVEQGAATTEAGAPAIAPALGTDNLTIVPSIFTVTPNHGPNGGGTLVQVTGAGFIKGFNTTTINFLSSVSCSSTTQCQGLTLPIGNGGAQETVDLIASAGGITGTARPTMDQFTYDSTPICSVSTACADDYSTTMPTLTITCDRDVNFVQGPTTLRSNALSVSNVQTSPYAYDVVACEPALGTASCTTINAIYQYGMCGNQPSGTTQPPHTCGGVTHPATSCGTGQIWHCCGTTWECGAPSAACE